MTARKTPKKTPKTPQVELPFPEPPPGEAQPPALEPVGDIDKLKSIARAMLVRLEEALCAKGDEGQKAYEWLFGTKQPLISTLAMLAELLLKLGDMQEAGAASDALPLSEADVALVQEFLRRAT